MELPSPALLGPRGGEYVGIDVALAVKGVGEGGCNRQQYTAGELYFVCTELHTELNVVFTWPNADFPWALLPPFTMLGNLCTGYTMYPLDSFLQGHSHPEFVYSL